MSKTVEHITRAESLIKKIDNADGAALMAGDVDRWLQEANVHALLAIAYKLVIG